MYCPKCQSPMNRGFQIDGVSRENYRQAQWAPGPPAGREDTFLGMKIFEEWVLKLDLETLRPIVTYRCGGCGFLENYAE